VLTSLVRRHIELLRPLIRDEACYEGVRSFVRRPFEVQIAPAAELMPEAVDDEFDEDQATLQDALTTAIVEFKTDHYPSNRPLYDLLWNWALA